MPKNSKKNPKIVAQYRKYPIPYVYTLNRTIAYLYTLSRTIPYLNTLSRTIPYLNTLSRTIPYLNTLSRTIHYLNTLTRTIPYLNTLKKPNFSPKPNSCRQPIRIEHEKTLKPRQPIRNEYHSAETYPILIHGWGTLLAPGHESAAIAYLNTWRVPHPPPPRLINSHSYYCPDLVGKASSSNSFLLEVARVETQVVHRIWIQLLKSEEIIGDVQFISHD